MIICKTPHRISLCGGGSDFKDFFDYNVGAVLSFAINKYQYHFFEDSYDNINHLSYLNVIENTKNINDIKHIGIKNILKNYNINNITYNIISNTYYNIGLGSSSCFYVSIFNIINEYKKLNLSKSEIADLAYKFETEILKMPIGKQDQFATTFGGINLIEFTKDSVNVNNLNNINYGKLIDNLILFKLERFNSIDILKQMKYDLSNNTKIIQKMVDLVYQLNNELLKNNFSDIGYILNENWEYKKKLNNNISNDYINKIYNIGIKNGATGGKIIGAGGGGGILFYSTDIDKLKNVFNYLDEIPFDIDLDGTKIIYNYNDTKLY